MPDQSPGLRDPSRALLRKVGFFVAAVSNTFIGTSGKVMGCLSGSSWVQSSENPLEMGREALPVLRCAVHRTVRGEGMQVKDVMRRGAASGHPSSLSFALQGVDKRGQLVRGRTSGHLK